MRKALIAATTAAAGLVLGLGVGVAVAQARTTPARPASTTVVTADGDGWMDQMHEQMQAQMPENLRAACNQLHDQMSAQMGASMSEHMNQAGSGMPMAGHHGTTTPTTSGQ